MTVQERIPLRSCAVALALLTATAAVHASPTKRISTAELYIGWPNDGEVITGESFRIWFGLKNMGIAPAGVDIANTGHHHLIIDSELPPFGEPIPTDKHHLHFGKGQTETILSLPKGTHTLQLLLGDYDHMSFDPPLYSRRITITVK